MKLLGVNLGLLWELKRARDAVMNANKAGFLWSVAFKKMGKNFLFVAGGLLAVHFSDPTNIAALLGVLPENLQKILVAFTVPVAIFIKNWWANHNNELVLMVPVAPPDPASPERRSTPQPVFGA